MKLKIIILSMLIATGPQWAAAISMGSISDSVANSLGSGDQPTYTAAIPKNPTQTTKKIAVAQPAPAGLTLPNPALFIEDAAMTGYIHAQLLLQKNISPVRITTENAVVSLSGTVDTQEQANTLVKVASAVKGVKYVNTDQLVIRTKA